MAGPVLSTLLAVHDLDRSVAFYRAALGAEVVAASGHYALLDVAGSRLHLALTGEAPDDRPGIPLEPVAGGARPGLLVVTVEDCVTARRRALDAGAAPVSEPTVPAWGGERRCFVLDPDGHVLELNEPIPG